MYNKSEKVSKVILSLGSNEGDRKENILSGIAMLEAVENFIIEKVSSLYETEPVGTNSNLHFYNVILTGITSLDPFELLDQTEKIERLAGRTEKGDRKPRTLDIDIIFFENELIESEKLVIPHPRLHERLFVLIPLQEVEPGYTCPLTRKSINSMIENVNDVTTVRKLGSIYP